MTLRAVLWDLDGTLTDSVRFVVDTANRVIEAHGGSPLAFESVGAMTGLPLEEIFRMAWPDLTPDLAHSYRAGDFMDPFETTVPLDGDTSTYPFHHLKVEISALARTAGGVRSGKTVPLRLGISNSLAGYRVSTKSAVREGALVDAVLHVDPSWAAVLFAVFIMVVMWGLALGALAVAVSLVARRRRFEAGFTGFLAVLLFAFPTVRNSLPGIPPVGVLLDYAAFFWAEALVALALIVLIAGWTVRALAGTTERRN